MSDRSEIELIADCNGATKVNLISVDNCHRILKHD